MEFVVDLLRGVFRLSESEAERITFEIHKSGEGVVGTYTKDIAETKALHAQQKARDAEHPLMVNVRCVE
jgi:ATP-dependent Clp protease adaptor protein ClpS